MQIHQFSYFKGGITQTKLTQSIDYGSAYNILVSNLNKTKIKKIRAEKDLETQRGFTLKLEQLYCGFIFGDECTTYHNLTPIFQSSY
jgi:hypothetical protein